MREMNYDGLGWGLLSRKEEERPILAALHQSSAEAFGEVGGRGSSGQS